MPKMVILYFLVLLSAVGLFYLGWQTAEIKVVPASLNNISAESIRDLAKVFPKKDIGLKMVFVGDVMLSRGVANQIRKNNNFNYPFLRIADYLNSFDLVIGNLEGPISDKGKNQGSIYSFRANPQVVEGLRFAGFDLLSLANNHMLDWGREALIQTREILEAHGIEAAGVGKDYAQANKPAVFEINGQKLAFLSYTNLYPKSLAATEAQAGVSNFSVENIVFSIENFKKEGNLVTVLMHWGDEYQTKSNASQQKLARGFIDAGASLVVGHHPHVVEEIEKYGDGWIAYSLGNFVFDQSFSEETMRGVAFEVEVKDGRILAVKPQEIEINSFFQPDLAE